MIGGERKLSTFQFTRQDRRWNNKQIIVENGKPMRQGIWIKLFGDKMPKSGISKIEIVKPEWKTKQTNKSENVNVKTSKRPKDPKPKKPSLNILKPRIFFLKDFWHFGFLKFKIFDIPYFDIMPSESIKSRAGYERSSWVLAVPMKFNHTVHCPLKLRRKNMERYLPVNFITIESKANRW